jgi:hypothetical protein
MSTTGGTLSPVNKMSPVQNTENHAQFSVIGVTGDTGGVLDTSGGGGRPTTAAQQE